MLATEYAAYEYEQTQNPQFAPQAEGESDHAFKNRVAAGLRAQNRIIEAHEALQDARWDNDDSGNVARGIMGFMAQELQGDPYGNRARPERGLGDDIAAGAYVESADERRQKSEMALLAMMLFGGNRR